MRRSSSGSRGEKAASRTFVHRLCTPSSCLFRNESGQNSLTLSQRLISVVSLVKTREPLYLTLSEVCSEIFGGVQSGGQSSPSPICFQLSCCCPTPQCRLTFPDRPRIVLIAGGHTGSHWNLKLSFMSRRVFLLVIADWLNTPRGGAFCPVLLSRPRNCEKKGFIWLFACFPAFLPIEIRALTDIAENARGFDGRPFGEQSADALGQSPAESSFSAACFPFHLAAASRAR